MGGIVSFFFIENPRRGGFFQEGEGLRGRHCVCGALGDLGGGGVVPSMAALSVPQHKLMCTIAFGGSTRID